MTALVRFERDGPVGHITLARGDVGNAVSSQMAREVRHVAEACANDASIRAVLLTGDGRSFCVGGDIVEFESAGSSRPQLVTRIADDFHAAEAALLGMDAPVVVAVQGAAAGAGFSLAMMGDLVLAGRSAHFTAAYTAIGLSADGGSTYILPRLIGLRRTQELLLTNRRLTADEAQAWGLVTAVHDDAELMPRAAELARRMAKGPTGAYGVVKRLLAQTYNTDFAAQVAVEGREIARLSGLPDGAEGISAFRGKRPPLFNG